jgi:thiamine-monophosphate kinase
MNEFELIRTYFTDRGPKRKDVVLGVGDDAALTRMSSGNLLVIATDTMVENVHFFSDADPRSIGHKALAVNLSDFAAMGAEPAWASVALTLPEANETWVKEFTDGLYEIAEYYNVQIVGGDTTKGPLTITVSLKGFVPETGAILRSGAKTGDWIYVTGQLGDSALVVESKLNNLSIPENQLTKAAQRFNYPAARIAAGQILRRTATSALDISDGLLQDMMHILRASNVSANINIDKLPISNNVLEAVDKDKAIELALMGGEDYELLFTLPEEQKGYLEQNATAMGINYTCIGQIQGGDPKITLTYEDKPYPFPDKSGYQHFSDEE